MQNALPANSNSMLRLGDISIGFAGVQALAHVDFELVAG